MFPWDHSARASALASVDAERRRLDENRDQERAEWAANADAIRVEARRQTLAQERIAAALEKLSGIECMPIDAGTGADTSGCGTPMPPWKCGETMPSGVVAQCDRCAGTGADTSGEAVFTMPDWRTTKHLFVENEDDDLCRLCRGATDDRTVHPAPQADAIKAAVDKANNRAADAFHDWNRTGNPFSDMTTDEFSAWIRSGADAPGAVSK